MPSDIVERLRNLDAGYGSGWNIAKLCGEAAGEIERLRGIVETVPHTADGVPMFNNMTVYYTVPNDSEVYDAKPYRWTAMLLHASRCYSTREAADAARKAGG